MLLNQICGNIQQCEECEVSKELLELIKPGKAKETLLAMTDTRQISPFSSARLPSVNTSQNNSTSVDDLRKLSEMLSRPRLLLESGSMRKAILQASQPHEDHECKESISEEVNHRNKMYVVLVAPCTTVNVNGDSILMGIIWRGYRTFDEAERSIGPIRPGTIVRYAMLQPSMKASRRHGVLFIVEWAIVQANLQ